MKMELFRTCPVCNRHSLEVACTECGWHAVTAAGSISQEIVDTPKLANELGEFMCIPCDMCRKWFHCDDCPPEIEKCNGKKHWRMMLERILDDETN